MGGAKLRRIPCLHPCAEAGSGGDGSSKQALKREAKMYERLLLKTAAAMIVFGLTVSTAAAEDYKLVEPGKLTIATTAEMPGIVPTDNGLAGYDGEILALVAKK